jgi:FkbM family methyltransferase
MCDRRQRVLNTIERFVDTLDPGLSVRLRALKHFGRDGHKRLMQEMIQPGDVTVDVGANRGAYTYIMSRRVGPGGRVHAIDPFPGHGRRLQTVARRRGNVVVHAVAVSDHSGRAVLQIPVHDGHRIDALATLEPNRPWHGDSYEIPVHALDELLAGERRISFVKCDVEGHEQRVFEGAKGILDRDRPVVLIELEQRHRAEPIETAFTFFADAGYDGWFIRKEELHPLEDFDVARDQLALLNGGFRPYTMPAGYVSDFLFCPRETPLASRLIRSARPSLSAS